MKNYLHPLPKVFIFFAAGLVLTVPLRAQMYAQARSLDQGTVTPSEQQSITDILTKLEKAFKVNFNYDSDALRTIYLKSGFSWSKNEKLEEILSRLLQNLSLTYKKLNANKYVIYSPKKKATLKTSSSVDIPTPVTDSQEVMAASRNFPLVSDEFTFSGRVTTTEGSALPGVNVLLKGTTLGTATDGDGRYVLSVPDASGTIVFSFIGYTTKEVVLNGQTTIDVTLEPDVHTLGEILVVGYGAQEKREITGSISNVSGKELATNVVSSVDQALQGRVPGVMITTNSGEPGGGISMRVRGIGGFGVSEPLYVIDGVIVTYGDNAAAAMPGTGSGTFAIAGNNPLATLNMNDIESINVLKDASAAAIYGARGGNGVVIITTKRGKEGRPKLNVSSAYGYQVVNRKIDMMGAAEYARFSNDARTAAELPLNTKFADPASLGQGTDWQDEIFRTAAMQEHQLSLSGGTQATQYFVSAGYLEQDGVIIGSSFNRYSLRLNLDNKVTNWLKIGNSLTISRTKNRSLSNNSGDKFTGIIAQALRRSPTLNVYNADGSWAGPEEADRVFLGSINNPVMLATINRDPLERIRILGNMYAEVTILKDFHFKTSVGADYVIQNYNGFRPGFRENSLTNTRPLATATKNTYANVLTENTITYKKDIGSKHHVEVLAGYTAQLATTEILTASSSNHLSDAVITIDGGVPTNPNRTANGTINETSYISLLGRLNYAFQDKYFLTANIRRDGSSVFSSRNRFGVFPSFSAGWMISEESFLADLPVLSSLKLRASWGQVGIDGSLPIAAEYSTYASVYNYNFNGSSVTGLAANNFPNRNLGWETVTQTDIGLDVSFFNNRLTLVADYFVKRNADLITNRNMPVGSGIVSSAYYDNVITMPVNIATVDNKGIELYLGYQNNVGNLGYNLSANFTALKNKVIKLPFDIPGAPTGNGQERLTLTQVGHAVGEFYGYVSDGVFQSQEELDEANAKDGNPATFYQSPKTAPGDVRFKDLDGDNLITTKDRTFIGSAIPDFSFGFNASVTYKNFDLTLFLQGVQGNEIFNVNRMITEGSADGENKGTAMNDRWTETNSTSNIPRAITTDPNDNDRASTRFVEDGSYLRLKNFQLGYNFNTELLSKLSISNLRIHFTAQNLFTITGYKGYTPDIGSQGRNNLNSGIDNTIYPQSKSYLLGINIGL